LSHGEFRNPRTIALQWRYAFVTDDDGMKVVDITEPAKPKLLPEATVRLQHPGRLYIARTYAYVANGSEGLAIIDIENPEKPKLDQMFNAGGVMNDTRAVQLGAISASMFALVADGRNGLRVVQLISPENVSGFNGFSPRPNPKLIATYKTGGEAVAVSRGLDRDRVADETGNQTVVFGRRGSRPFNLDEMAIFYRHAQNVDPGELKPKHTGELYRVRDATRGTDKLEFKGGEAPKAPLDFKMPSEPDRPATRAQTERVIRRGP
jgi:hypothetical protein